MAKFIFCEKCTLSVPDIFPDESKEVIVGLSKKQTTCSRCKKLIRSHSTCAQILTNGDLADGMIIPVDEYEPVIAAKALAANNEGS